MVDSAKLLRLTLVGGVATIALAHPAGALVQTASASTAVDTERLDEEGAIIVTAQRRAERLEDVPMSITAVNAEVLDTAGVNNIHELGTIVPGTQINFGGGFTQPAIRGISTLTTGIGFENNVAIYVDGFYSPDTVTINGDLANIEQVQVLKGPQGALWGRNATGGAILINTKAPSDTFTGYFQGSYGRFDDKSVSAYLSGPATESIRVSVAGYVRSSDGYNKLVDPSGSGELVGDATPLLQQSLRMKVEADISADLTATAAYNHGLSSDARGLLFNTFQFVPPFLPAANFRGSRPFTASYNRETYLRAETDELTLTLNYDTEFGKITSYTGYARRGTKIGYDFDGTYAQITYQDQIWDQSTFQQGLDLSIDTINNLDLIIGGSYYNDHLENEQQRNFGAGGVFTNTFTNTLKAEAVALYVDGTIRLTDQLSVSAGGRYNRESKATQYQQVTPAGSNVIQPGSANETFDGFTPRASIRYEIAPRTNIYASYSEGFRSGAFNPQGAPNPGLLIPIRPEHITSYELGFKTANRTLRFEAAGFFYDYSDLQVGVVIPNPTCPTTCAVVTLISNAPKAEVYGIEASLNWNPVEGLNLGAGGALIHSEYKNFPNATGTGWNAATGLNVPGQRQDWSGQQMARAPTFSGFVNGSYKMGLGASGSIEFAGDIYYSDSMVNSSPSLWGPLAGAELANKQRARQPAYTLLDAQLTWYDPSDRFWVGFWGKNLTNAVRYLTYSPGSFGDYHSYAPPRTYGVRLGHKF